jgi:inhibitor of KinA sporulation pathway (predicted exonuclease)
LKNALNALDIEVDGKLHRAMDDAIHTAKLFIKIFNEEMREQIQ